MIQGFPIEHYDILIGIFIGTIIFGIISVVHEKIYNFLRVLPIGISLMSLFVTLILFILINDSLSLLTREVIVSGQIDLKENRIGRNNCKSIISKRDRYLVLEYLENSDIKAKAIVPVKQGYFHMKCEIPKNVSKIRLLPIDSDTTYTVFQTEFDVIDESYVLANILFICKNSNCPL